MRSPKSATVLALIAGALLIVSGVSGSVGIIGTVLEYLIDHLGGSTANMLSIVLRALNFVASLGGLAVMVGGILIHVGRKRLAKFIIDIGAGMGLIGFLIVIGSAFLHGWAHTVAFLLLISQSLGWIGIILAIVATLLAR